MDDNNSSTISSPQQPLTAQNADESVSANNKKSSMPLILIIVGILESIQPGAMIFTVIPQLATLNKNLNNTSYNPIISYGLIGIILLFALAQIVYGVMLFIKQKQTGTLDAKQKKIAEVLLIAGIVATFANVPIAIISVLTPIYNVSKAIQ